MKITVKRTSIGVNFIILNMTINVFGNSSNISGNRIDTSLFVQKLYLRTNFLKTSLDEDIDLKNPYRIKNSIDPISIREPASENCVDIIIRNDIDFNDVKLENNKFLKVNYQPAFKRNQTPKLYVYNAIDEISLVRFTRVNDLNNLNLTKIKSSALNTQAVKDNEVITKSSVDHSHQENEQSRRDLGMDSENESSDIVKNNQDYDFNGNNLTNLDSIKINRSRSLDNEVSNI